MRIKKKSYSLLVLLQLFLLTSESYSQFDEILDLLRIRNERTLNNHVFTPNSIIRSPFITTDIKTTLGVGGIEGIQIPLIEVNEKEYKKVQGDLLVAILGFGYQHGVKDWLAVHIRFGLAGRIGTDFATALTEGINFATSLKLAGWLRFIKMINL